MLKDKVAVVTGASSGIGASLAIALAKEGATVVLAARRKQKLEKVAADVVRVGGKALAVKCDVTVKEDAEELIDDTIEHFGRLDILINNAGRGHLSSIEDTTDTMIESMFAVNAYSLWYTTRPALPLKSSTPPWTTTTRIRLTLTSWTETATPFPAPTPAFSRPE